MRPGDITPGIRYLAGRGQLLDDSATTVPLCAQVETVSGRAVTVRWVHEPKLRDIADTSALTGQIPPRMIERPWTSSDWGEVAATLHRHELVTTQAAVGEEVAALLERLAHRQGGRRPAARTGTRARNATLHTAIQLRGLDLRAAAATLTALADAEEEWDGPTTTVTLDGLTGGGLTQLQTAAAAALGTDVSALSAVLTELLDRTVPPDS